MDTKTIDIYNRNDELSAQAEMISNKHGVVTISYTFSAPIPLKIAEKMRPVVVSKATPRKQNKIKSKINKISVKK